MTEISNRLTPLDKVSSLTEASGEQLAQELSRSEKILAEKTVCVLLVRGEDPDGTPIYAYVGVRADRLKEFMEAQQKGVFYPEEYGVIIHAGQGDPDPEVRTMMERDYGFNHEAMIDVPGPDHANKIAADLSKAVRAENESGS
jgi:hypothetical protein